MTEPPRASAQAPANGHGVAGIHLHGKVLVDRYDRTTDEVRAQAVLAAEQLEKLREIARCCEHDLFVAVPGSKFFRRFAVQIESLERVVRRDERWLVMLDEAAARRQA